MFVRSFQNAWYISGWITIVKDLHNVLYFCVKYLLTFSSLRSLQSGAPSQSFPMSTHSPLEQWNSVSSQDPSSTSLWNMLFQVKVNHIENQTDRLPAHNTYCLCRFALSPLVEFALPKTLLPTVTLKAAYWWVSSVPAGSLYHLGTPRWKSCLRNVIVMLTSFAPRW